MVPITDPLLFNFKIYYNQLEQHTFPSKDKIQKKKNLVLKKFSKLNRWLKLNTFLNTATQVGEQHSINTIKQCVY